MTKTDTLATQDSSAAPVAPELVSAMVPDHLLHGDELVLLLTKPSPWFIFVTSFRFCLIVLLVATFSVRAFELSAASYITPQQVALAATVLILGRLVWAGLVWTSHIYMLTNQRVVTIKGVFNVVVFQANLHKIQRTVLYKPLPYRLLGIGTIGISTAASTSNEFESTWVMVARPLKTHERLVEAVNKAQR